jgi:hypothetical protein
MIRRVRRSGGTRVRQVSIISSVIMAIVLFGGVTGAQAPATRMPWCMRRENRRFK